MKLHKRQLGNGQVVIAYNDSNIDWVVESSDNASMRFDKRTWTLKAAIEFYIDLYRIGGAE